MVQDLMPCKEHSNACKGAARMGHSVGKATGHVDLYKVQNHPLDEKLVVQKFSEILVLKETACVKQNTCFLAMFHLRTHRDPFTS